jgi:hypothetical protein
MLNSTQTSALKAFIETDSVFTELLLPGNENAFAIAELLKVKAIPDFVVWRSAILPAEYLQAIVWTEIKVLAVSDARVWEWISANMTANINAGNPAIRQAIADAFSGAAAAGTRNALAAIAKRNANRLEKVLSTGTGTTANPATMGYEGGLSYAEISNVMGW